MPRTLHPATIAQRAAYAAATEERYPEAREHWREALKQYRVGSRYAMAILTVLKQDDAHLPRYH